MNLEQQIQEKTIEAKKIVDKFIRFLKDNHAFDEYKSIVEETLPTDEIPMDAIEYILMSGLRPSDYLKDGTFFWHESSDEADWKSLDKEWCKMIPEEIV